VEVSSSALYTDFSDLHELKYNKSVDEKTRLKEVAKQFEGIFLQMMLKSMRDANMGDDLFDSDQSKMYQDLFDKQISLELGKKGSFGLAEMMVRQMDKTQVDPANSGKNISDYMRNTIKAAENITGRTMSTVSSIQVTRPDISNENIQSAPATEATAVKETQAKAWETPESFIKSMIPHARAVASKLGVNPAFIVAQAALETGWGAHVMKSSNGLSSNNLFGIKAGNSWQGNTVQSNTLEFRDGIMKQEKASFRSYSSLGDAFNDYASFLTDNARYKNVVNSGNDVDQFTRNLSKAGYATDPVYANKIKTIVQSDRMKSIMKSSF